MRKRTFRRVNGRARKAGVRVVGQGWRGWRSKYRWVYARRLITHKHFLLPGKPVDTVVMHITVTNRTGNFRKDMQTVERIGYERFKSGFSYNIGWDMKTGTIGIGMPLGAKGTHTVNDKKVPGFSRDQNGMAIAIAAIGMPGDIPTDQAVAKLATYIACLRRQEVVTGDFDFEPHSLFAYKDCPTDAIRKVMPVLYRKARQLESCV